MLAAYIGLIVTALRCFINSMSACRWLYRERNSIIFFLLGLPVPFSGGQTGTVGQTSAIMTRTKVAHRFLLNKFYDTPTPLPMGQPGDLIRSTEFDRYDLPGDVSAVRILYHSVSANQNDVPVSGVVLVPDKKPPAGGWPIIAWAHDLNGVGRSCAPSLERNLRNGSFLSMYVQLGYAVVATDYAGLGSNTRSAFADMKSNAADVIYSVAAARHAVPQLGTRWVALGTGEGAMAVVAVGELERERHDDGYLGSIAISDVQDLREKYEALSAVSMKSLLELVYGVQTVFPAFQPTAVLNSTELSLFKRVASDCAESDAAFGDSSSSLVGQKWKSDPLVQAYFDRNRLGVSAAKAPLLVLSSLANSHAGDASKIVSRLCAVGDKVQFDNYRGSDQGTLIGDSVRDQIQWIEGAFAGRPAHNDCSSRR